MANKILVAYATRYGSTQEVAGEVAARLRENGHEVDIQFMRKVQTLEPYRAVVLGAPIFVGKWHKDAHGFLSLHKNVLMQKPVAIFALGPLSTDKTEMQGSRAQLDQELATYLWLTPVAVEMFVGRYDPAKLGLAHKLMAALPASPLHGRAASDHRDWDAIRAWASKLPTQFTRRITSNFG